MGPPALDPVSILGTPCCPKTGDAGPDAGLLELARGADVLLAEATCVDMVPADTLGSLSSARNAGRQAAVAGVGALVLTLIPPGDDRAAVRGVAAGDFSGPIGVTRLGLDLIIGDALADNEGDQAEAVTPSDRASAPPS